jgi:hypothetical protein
VAAYWITVYREIVDKAKVAAFALDGGAVHDMRILPGV